MSNREVYRNGVRTGRLSSDQPNLSLTEVRMMAQFPHCDNRILHAPGKCKYCDMHPELQQDRIDKRISFTGEPPQRGMYPCPAEQARSSESLNAWPGNRAVTDDEENLYAALADDLEARGRSNPNDSTEE